MKTLFLLRHARAEKAGPAMTDFKRPLSDSGIKDAKRVSQWFMDQKLVPEKIISSLALRARTTALLFADTFRIPGDSVELFNELYDCTEKDYYEVIAGIDDAFASCMIAGHNDTISGVAEKLTHRTMDSMKTCGVVVITADVHSWKEFISTRGTLTLSFYPSLLE